MPIVKSYCKQNRLISTGNLKPLVILLLLLSSDFARAGTVTIEVTIKSVDAKNRSITCTRNGKALELDVSRKAEVIINGKAGQLNSLAGEQPAKIDYETTLEIVTKIEAIGDPSKNVEDTPSLLELAELNSGTYTTDPWIAPDGLTIYWTFEGSIWTAQRKDSESLFGKKQKLVRGRHATVDASGLRMVLLAPRSDGQKGESLHEAHRNSKDGAFSRPREIRELRNVLTPKSPCLAPDGLTLYFNRQRNKGTEFGYATRKTPSEPWNAPKLLAVDAGGIEGRITWSFVTDGGLTLLCSVEGYKDAGKTGNLLVLSRKSNAAPFENPRFVSVEGLAPLTGRSARYVKATRELVFARSVKHKEFSLWMVKDFKLDAMPDAQSRINPSLQKPD